MARKRKSLSKRQRFEVFKRDNFTCVYCGRKPPVVVLEADHVIAIANGGEDHQRNMVTSCEDCNSGKSAVPLEKFSKPLVDQIVRQKEAREQIKQYEEFLEDQRSDEDSTIQRIGLHWYNHYKPNRDQFVFGPARVPSIRTFLKSMMPIAIIVAIDKAHVRVPVEGDDDDRTFRYFCGICWNQIREAEDGKG